MMHERCTPAAACGRHLDKLDKDVLVREKAEMERRAERLRILFNMLESVKMEHLDKWKWVLPGSACAALLNMRGLTTLCLCCVLCAGQSCGPGGRLAQLNRRTSHSLLHCTVLRCKACAGYSCLPGCGQAGAAMGLNLCVAGCRCGWLVVAVHELAW